MGNLRLLLSVPMISPATRTAGDWPQAQPAPPAGEQSRTGQAPHTQDIPPDPVDAPEAAPEASQAGPARREPRARPPHRGREQRQPLPPVPAVLPRHQRGLHEVPRVRVQGVLIRRESDGVAPAGAKPSSARSRDVAAPSPLEAGGGEGPGKATRIPSQNFRTLALGRLRRRNCRSP
jgi:hypothetical protein